MKRLLLSALTVTMVTGLGGAYEKATPGMMKSALEPISTRTLPTGEIEMTLGMPLTLNQLKGKKVTGFSKTTGVATRAEEEQEPFMEFTYSSSPYAAYFMEEANGEPVYMAIYFPDLYTRMYNNCRVKSLSFITGINGQSETNRLTTTTVFIAKDMPDIPDNLVYSRSHRVTSEAFAEETIDIADDYIIKEGEPFYIGYTASPTSAVDYFMVTDGMLTSQANGALVGVMSEKGLQWTNVGPELGNICIYLTIVGEDLPKNGAQIYNMSLPMQVDPDTEFEARVDIINMNSNPITSFDYTYKIGAAEAVSATQELPEPLPYSDVVPFTLAGLKTSEVGLNIPFEFAVTKVNGVDNYFSNASSSMNFKSFNQSQGFEPHALIEEGTGNWCGYCPIGISMMEYAAENYPEYYHRAALHFDGSGYKDPMNIPSIAEMGKFFPGLPTALINRWADYYPGYYKELLPLFKEEYGSVEAAAGVTELSVSPADKKNTTKVTASVKFALDLENDGRYRLGFYIIENGVGPYEQTNYYSGENGDFDGWEDMPAKVRKQMYDDVVRYLVGGANGCENSIPAEIKAGETYTYTAEADLSAVTGEDFNVIAFILDNERDEILNSAILETNKTADVEGLEVAAKAKVYGVKGGIVISGDYAKAEVISVDGKKVAELSGKQGVALAQGIYIVVVDGKTSKVVVK